MDDHLKYTYTPIFSRDSWADGCANGPCKADARSSRAMDLVEPRWGSSTEWVSDRRTPKKSRWRIIPQVGAGTFSKPHVRVLAWWIEMANVIDQLLGLAVDRGLDCPVASDRSSGAERKMRDC